MGSSQAESDKVFDAFAVVPVGRAGLSDELADSILYLASDHAAFITGTNLIVDGGCVAANNINADILKTN